MNLDITPSPSAFLQAHLGDLYVMSVLHEMEKWWENTGREISHSVDQAGTPWVKQFDARGQRIDEIQMSAGYRDMLHVGYRNGVIWRAFEETLLSSFVLGYVTSFYDMGLYCPYTLSLVTAVTLDKYGPPSVRDGFLRNLLRKDEGVWQGATWMTEIRGGSDLGASVETIASPTSFGQWSLQGEKYFCSNVGAEVAIVAARPSGASQGIRNLALFLVPKYRQNGALNYHVRRLKDKIATRSVPTGEVELDQSEAYLLGDIHTGMYVLLEVLNLSRVCNSIASIAVMQRAIGEAYTFAKHRIVFGKPLIDQPLMRAQFEARAQSLTEGFALAWESALLANQVWQETGPNYSERFHLFRLVTHLAKYWTAELATQTAKWSMEVHGGIGTLAEFGVERLLREAMIADIWEGPPHRQILDGLEVIERKRAHELLFNHLAQYGYEDEQRELRQELETYIQWQGQEREAHAEQLFKRLAQYTAKALAVKNQQEVFG